MSAPIEYGDIPMGRAGITEVNKKTDHFSNARLATVFQAGRCVGFILDRGLPLEATAATGHD
jgi:hypothetical protein